MSNCGSMVLFLNSFVVSVEGRLWTFQILQFARTAILSNLVSFGVLVRAFLMLVTSIDQMNCYFWTGESLFRVYLEVPLRLPACHARDLGRKVADKACKLP